MSFGLIFSSYFSYGFVAAAAALFASFFYFSSSFNILIIKREVSINSVPIAAKIASV
jgi:hypothetical protein